jgi:hypothetical protein
MADVGENGPDAVLALFTRRHRKIAPNRARTVKLPKPFERALPGLGRAADGLAANGGGYIRPQIRACCRRLANGCAGRGRRGQPKTRFRGERLREASAEGAGEASFP